MRGWGWDEDDEALQPSRLRPVVGAGFLLSTCPCSLDGLCTKRESERRAPLGALKREDYTWTMTLTITSLLHSARCCLEDLTSFILECLGNMDPCVSCESVLNPLNDLLHILYE